MAAGFNSIGIQSAGGAGMALADLIVKGRMPQESPNSNPNPNPNPNLTLTLP